MHWPALCSSTGSSAKIGAGKLRPLRPCNRLNVLYSPFSEANPGRKQPLVPGNSRGECLPSLIAIPLP
jgi:hypothetical protein